MSPKELEAQYQVRHDLVGALVAKGKIQASDVLSLDRLGCIKVANEFWSICDQSARDALLHSEHAHVRSCARLAVVDK
jgi:hypothetical protein